MSIRIAFKMMGKDAWYAGFSYLKNLFHALRYNYKGKLTIYLLLSNIQQSIPDDIKQYTHEIIEFHNRRRRHLLQVIDRLLKRLFSFDLVSMKILNDHKIDVLFGQMIDNKYGKIPVLSWFPDFQHIHLPEMFSEQEIYNRNKIFFKTAKLSTLIILMSEYARKDFESFVPKYSHKVKVLHPISCIPQSVYDHDLNSIVNLYHLPEKFVYLPNQFWKHKNHETVFYALKILKDRGNKVIVVCTGYPGDSRHPTYFPDLWQKISQWNIRDQIIYLGLIPHEHVLLLIRQSICVLNPSLFEGWGYTVEEARSVGKQVLISDIPAHREQNPPKVTFFDPKDSEELSEKLCEIWQETSPGSDIELEKQSRDAIPERIRNYAQSFMSVVHEAINEMK